uniref:Uncharacterized protein MANES_01G055500 n=1 Tax=Rhizophora mucronata TaxID=61149 RepID=A0A2P2LYP8_RHIMU
MAVVENVGVDLGTAAVDSSLSSSQNSSVSSLSSNDQDQSINHNNHHHLRPRIDNGVPIQVGHHHPPPPSPPPHPHHNDHHQPHHRQQRSAGGDGDFHKNGDVGESFNRDMRELQELFSKLNPMAEEFVPPSLAYNNKTNSGLNGLHLLNVNAIGNAQLNGNASRRKKTYGQRRRRMNSRTGMAQREEVIHRTVYVSDIDQQVTEEQLAALFVGCGQVVDCRICGDPNSVLRFAFIEFTDEEGALAALNLSGTMLGYYPVRVLPSKTAIAPVNPTFLPRNDDEREMCTRTIYCTNIDKKVTQADVKLFFESICGEVYRLRLLGDYHHSTRIAFVEFVMVIASVFLFSLHFVFSRSS